MRWSPLSVVWFLLSLPFVTHSQSNEANQAWMLGPFTRPENAQPVITAQPQSVFTDPILGKPVHWEALHTFNPGAIVSSTKVCCFAVMDCLVRTLFTTTMPTSIAAITP